MPDLLGGFEVATALCACRGGGQDRAAVLAVDGGLAIAVADGAGGRGAAAAQAVIDTVAAVARGPFDPIRIVAGLDRDPRGTDGGETTAVVVRLTAGGLVGASVGDSVAWLVDDAVIELTAAQRRSPLVGSGAAIATPFATEPWRGTLLVATDGLAGYVRRAALVAALAADALEVAAARLIELVRLPTGEVPDDVALVLVRRPRPRS